jgi:integrase
MELLLSGVDRTLIALWLGHESVETTQIYLDANLAIKEEILAKTTPINAKGGRYRPDDDLLAFLADGWRAAKSAPPSCRSQYPRRPPPE